MVWPFLASGFSSPFSREYSRIHATSSALPVLMKTSSGSHMVMALAILISASSLVMGASFS